MQSRQIFLLFLVSFAPIALPQTPGGWKRVSPPPKNVPPLLREYDFGAQLQTLQDSNSVPAEVKSSPAAPTVPSAPNGAVPKDFHPRTDVPLTPTAVEAVRVSERWQGEKNAPSPGRDGRVIYSFGGGLATVVCAPLRICMIELQVGEKIVGEPHIGDSVRWNISPGMYGTGDQATPVIILKPQTPGLDTNLLITTDRRAYYVRLVSKAEDYVARVAFAYPEDDSKKWQQQLAEQQARAKQEKKGPELPAALISVEKMNFGYTVRGGDEHVRPVRVFDDGTKTYLQMPLDLEHRELPVLIVVGKDGKGELSNYRVHDRTYIVDRLFDDARLILGAGKKAQKVEITRERNKG